MSGRDRSPKHESKARGLSLFTSTFRTSGPDVFDLRLNSHSRPGKQTLRAGELYLQRVTASIHA